MRGDLRGPEPICASAGSGSRGTRSPPLRCRASAGSGAACPRRRARRCTRDLLGLEDPHEVDQALARVGEAPRLIEVLDVVLADAAVDPAKDVDGVVRASPAPEEVELEVHVARVGLLDEDVERGPRRVVGEPEELPVVVVVPEPQPRRACAISPARLRSCANAAQVAESRTTSPRPEVDPEERDGR